MENKSQERVSFYVPVKMNDKESLVINSFKKWEKASRIYAGIFTKHHPWELLEYINTIETAAENCTWDSVYTCHDLEKFRPLFLKIILIKYFYRF